MLSRRQTLSKCQISLTTTILDGNRNLKMNVKVVGTEAGAGKMKKETKVKERRNIEIWKEARVQREKFKTKVLKLPN
jgi:hypothetical protein